MEIEDFIKRFSENVRDKKALVFLGSGINAEIDLPTWDQLTEQFLKKVNIDLSNSEQERFGINNTDIAQYIENDSSRNDLLTIIDESLNTKVEHLKPGKNLISVTSLPVEGFWTTNYDNFIEKSLKKQNRNYEVIYKVTQFVTNNKNNNCKIYKMHGTVNDLESIVITEDDYISYDEKNYVFRDMFSLELCSKSCVFIGTSFDDFNLNLILQKSKLLNRTKIKTIHYIIFLKSKDQKLKLIQEFKSKDLERKYKIKTVYIDDYEQISSIFDQITFLSKSKDVFISGTIADDEFTDDKNNLIVSLASELVKKDYKINNGYGLNVGNGVLVGATSFLSEKNKVFSDYLTVIPFPQGIQSEEKRKSVFHANRNLLLNKSGIQLILYGSKKDENNKIIESSGIYEEYKIAKEKGLRILPIPKTGYVAEKIWSEIKENCFKDFEYLKELKDDIESAIKSEEIVNLIEKINKDWWKEV